MKTLGQIIDEVRSGLRPDYEELRYSVCALESLLIFNERAIHRLSVAETKKEKPFLTSSANYQFKECWNRSKTALNAEPRSWVGWENDPENPEFVERRRASIVLFEKLINKAEAK